MLRKPHPLLGAWGRGPGGEGRTWFIHERILVLRISSTKNKFWQNIAWTFDIKNLTPKNLVLTNTTLGDVTWRSTQTNDAATPSEPVRRGQIDHQLVQ
jgi:hypothetical protein